MEPDVKETNTKQQMEEIIQNEKRKIETKINLKSKNSNVSYPDETYFAKKNSSLKKNTGFVKKIKIFSEQTKDALCREMMELNLTRYIEEVAAAIVESKLKPNDISHMVDICSQLYRLYQDFSRYLLEQFRKQFTTYKTDKLNAKIKVDLKLFLDLVIVGVLSYNDSMKLLYGLVNHLINSDSEECVNLQIVIHFLKNSGFDLLGFLPKSIVDSCAQNEVSLPTELPILPPECGAKWGALLGSYCDNVIGRLRDVYRAMVQGRDANSRLLLAKGELSKEREERLTGLREKFEKLQGFCAQLADLLGRETPEFQEVDMEDAMNDPTAENGGGNADEQDNLGLFEDEETKSFYTDLCDLKAILPGICYKDVEQKQKKEEEEEEIENETDLDVDAVEKELERGDSEFEEIDSTMTEADQTALFGQGDLTADEAPIPTKIVVGVVGSTAATQAVKMPFDIFLNSLANCINRDLIDKASQEYCERYNTKANRSRLSRELFSVPRSRLDLLPFYARLIANISQITSEVGTEISQLLSSELRWHVRKRIQTNLDSKIKTVRFIGELVKFSVFRKHDALLCLRLLLHNFKHHDIDMTCALLESCGRILYRSRATAKRTQVLLTIIMRKKEVIVNDQRLATMIDNAYYYCNPPDIEARHHLDTENLTLPQRFLRRLLFVDLNKHNSDKVFKTVRKFDWNDREFMEFATRTFTEVWRVRYNNVPYLASVLAGLAPHHEDLVVAVVDNVIEEVRLGMEMNDPKYNQNRVSVIRYLGNFYVYKLINATVVLNVLYSLISFGVGVNESVESQIDPQDSFFRINLIHTLLDTCGQYFKTGSIAKKLDVYFLYLQRYFLYKKWLESRGREDAVVSVDDTENRPVLARNKNNPGAIEVLIEYQLYDLIHALRPKCKVYTDYEDCRAAVDRFQADCIRKLQDKSIFLEEQQQQQGLGAIKEEDNSDGDDDMRADTPTNGATSEDNETADDTAEDELQKDDKTDEEGEAREGGGVSKPRYIECNEDQEFQQLVDQIQTETNQNLQTNIKSNVNLNIAIPKHIKTKTEALRALGNSTETVSYALVTKKPGAVGKNQYTELNVPRDVQFVSRLIETAHETERQRKSLNRIVMACAKAQQQEEMQDDTHGFVSSSGRDNSGSGTSVGQYQDPRSRPVPHRGVPDISDVFRSSATRRK